MTKKNLFAEIPVNPFANRWITDPRQPDTVVESLNAKILNDLENVFTQVTVEVNLPVPIPAQLILSTEAGYGKSHLIGRFFRRLGKRATRVYIQPFVDPKNSWSSLLSQIVHELSQPDDTMNVTSNADGATQLDAMVMGILKHLIVFAEENKIASPDDRLFLERKILVSSFSELIWADVRFVKLEKALLKGLALKGFTSVKGTPRSYLRAFIAYAADRGNSSRRESCIEWLQGREIEADQIKSLGISKSDTLHSDAEVSTSNQFSKNTVIDLCHISKHHRPFVFCFDQTEVFEGHKDLIRAFGSLFSTLFQEAPNQLTIITANEPIWNAMKPALDKAYLDRLSRPHFLDGIRREQGKDLARQRLLLVDLPGPSISSFFEGTWLDTSFPVPSIPVREFLFECEKRFADLQGSQVVVNESLTELIENLRQQRLLNKNRQIFDSAILQWSVSDFIKSSAERVAEKNETRRQYFPVCWRDPKTNIKLIFGFEDGHNHATWRAMAEEAKRQVRQNVPGTRCVVLRSGDLPSIPFATWQTSGVLIQDAINLKCLLIQSVSRETLAKILAARDLYVRACQRDIPYSPADVEDFLNIYLDDWWVSLNGKVPSKTHPTVPPRPRDREITLSHFEKIVSSAKFVTTIEVINRLQSEFPGIAVTQDEILVLAGKCDKIIRFTHPNNAVFKWIG